MKKIFKKMYKILMALGVLFISIKNKVLAASPAYGVDFRDLEVAPAYGVDYIHKIDYIKIGNFIAIPIFWIIGIIVYWKKSKEEKKKKLKKLVIVNIIIIILILIGIVVFKMIG